MAASETDITEEDLSGPSPEDLAFLADRIREKPRKGDLDGLFYSWDEGESWDRLEDKA